MSVYTPSFGALGAATVVFEYQRASPTAKLRQFGTGPHARIVEHTLRRIDSAHRRRTTARDQNLSKGVVAAADVEPAKALRNSEPFEECFTDHAAPTAHAPFIGFAISEELFILAHVKYLDRLNSQARAYSKQSVAAKSSLLLSYGGILVFVEQRSQVSRQQNSSRDWKTAIDSRLPHGMGVTRLADLAAETR